MNEQEMINDVIKHLDASIEKDIKFMNVSVRSNMKEEKTVSSMVCGVCNGRPATHDVAYMDMLMDQGLHNLDRE